MARPQQPERPRMSFLTLAGIAFAFLILFDARLRTWLGEAIGFVLEPVIGFDHAYPVLTILLGGGIMVLLSTLVRHFTTDWLDMARTQAYMREFQKAFGKARKENNTYKMKKLQDKQPEVMQKQQQMTSRQFKTMPLTMVIVIPFFAWLLHFVASLPYPFYTTPWNPAVDMFGTDGIVFGSSVFPHWILLYIALSIPLGALVQKTMKYLSWKERWKGRHPEVHE